MTSVADIASILREDDVNVLYVEYNIPQEIAFHVPGKNDRAFLSPAGFVTVYEAHLRSGLRLPILNELMSIFQVLQVPITQFRANAIRYLCSICIFLHQHSRQLTISMVRGIFKLNQGPLPKKWGQVPEVYTVVPSKAETASLAWLVKLIEDNLGDFQRDHLVSRVERKKRKKGFIIGSRPSDASPPSPRQKRAASMAPSSSSSGPDYLSVGCFADVGTTSGIEVELALEAYETSLNNGVILAQPAPSGLLGIHPSRHLGHRSRHLDRLLWQF
ncbi:hypothetical protein Nepgr_018183 [Nepenthes gracilis]|uniref:Transposase n=1 Tax=Nepenthes gracilis TaxID=150966 RepID=A0AAD3SSH8_NEPGR|nr:hypothetical protein Nepgr_018183 [Nepenthes gracilis]